VVGLTNVIECGTKEANLAKIDESVLSTKCQQSGLLALKINSIVINGHVLR